MVARRCSSPVTSPSSRSGKELGALQADNWHRAGEGRRR